MMNVYRVLLGFVILSEIGFAVPSILGTSCQDHPAHVDGFKPVLIRSWQILHGIQSLPGLYVVGHEDHRYAPIDNLESLEYDRLDWFWVHKNGPSREKYVRLSLTRSAKVYMLISINLRKTKRNPPSPTLRGWTPEGVVKLVKGVGKPLQYGIYQKSTRNVAQTMYMFSKKTNGHIVLPNSKWIQGATKGLYVTSGDWLVMVSEADGAAPILQYPAKPAGVGDPITPNVRCPDELHDLWVTKSTDEEDDAIKGMTWKTWHPQWDPCYWCAYDHEHGSSPKDLMGYAPKFSYTAWKNGREEETHKGYKGYVVRQKSVFVYFMVHMQTSNMRRVGVRHHTVLVAVTDANTKELLMEVSHKADFGFIFVKGKNGRPIPLSKDERRMYESQLAEGMALKQRSINVINVAKPNPLFQYNMPSHNIRRGVYESWSTVPICSANNRFGAVVFDVVSSASGMKHITTSKPEPVRLGYYRQNTFYRQTGSARLVKLSGFSAGEQYCYFRVPSGHGRRFADGSFYTDAFGSTLHGGPGESSVRQFVKPGFSMRMGSGRYGAVESWTGLYERDVFGFIVNYGYTIDPDSN